MKGRDLAQFEGRRRRWILASQNRSGFIPWAASTILWRATQVQLGAAPLPVGGHGFVMAWVGFPFTVDSRHYTPGLILEC